MVHQNIEIVDDHQFEFVKSITEAWRNMFPQEGFVVGAIRKKYVCKHMLLYKKLEEKETELQLMLESFREVFYNEKLVSILKKYSSASKRNQEIIRLNQAYNILSSRVIPQIEEKFKKEQADLVNDFSYEVNRLYFASDIFYGQDIQMN